MSTPAEILAAGGLANADLIVQAASTTGLPLAILAAMIEKESGGKNIYGHDAGGVFSVAGQNVEVTQANFTEFRRRVVDGGEKSNGVGPSQITYRGYWTAYPDYPFWEPLANLKFGATLLLDLLDGDTSDASISSAGAHYNGGTSPNEKAVAYGADLLAKTITWRARLAVASEISEASVSYNFITQYDSPNYGGFGTQIALPAKRAVLHWWGNPSGQNPQGIIAWLCSAASQVSAHAVVWKGNVACLVNYDEPSWANGNTAANTSAITLECDPNDIDGTTPTIVAYLADLVRQGNLVEDFELTGHRDWYATECPGAYYPRLTEIRQAVRDNLAGTTTDTATTDTEDIFMSTEATELLGTIADRLLVVGDALTVGEEGVKFDGDVIACLRSIESKLEGLATTAGPERAEPEPAIPAETAPVTGATAIREALATARAALSIIEANL